MLVARPVDNLKTTDAGRGVRLDQGGIFAGSPNNTYSRAGFEARPLWLYLYIFWLQHRLPERQMQQILDQVRRALSLSSLRMVLALMASIKIKIRVDDVWKAWDHELGQVRGA